MLAQNKSGAVRAIDIMSRLFCIIVFIYLSSYNSIMLLNTLNITWKYNVASKEMLSEFLKILV